MIKIEVMEAFGCNYVRIGGKHGEIYCEPFNTGLTFREFCNQLAQGIYQGQCTPVDKREFGINVRRRYQIHYRGLGLYVKDVKTGAETEVPRHGRNYLHFGYKNMKIRGSIVHVKVGKFSTDLPLTLKKP